MMRLFGMTESNDHNNTISSEPLVLLKNAHSDHHPKTTTNYCGEPLVLLKNAHSQHHNTAIISSEPLVLLKNHTPYHEQNDNKLLKDHVLCKEETDYSSRTLTTRGETEFDDDFSESSEFYLDASERCFAQWQRFMRKREKDLKDEQLQLERKLKQSNLVEQMFANALGIAPSSSVDSHRRLEDIIEDDADNSSSEECGEDESVWMAPMIMNNSP